MSFVGPLPGDRSENEKQKNPKQTKTKKQERMIDDTAKITQ